MNFSHVRKPEYLQKPTNNKALIGERVQITLMRPYLALDQQPLKCKARALTNSLHKMQYTTSCMEKSGK